MNSARLFASCFIIILIFFQIPNITAQENARADSPESIAQELEENLRIALLNRDTEAMEKMWADDFMVNNPANSVLQGLEAVLERVRDGIIRYSSYEQKIEAVLTRKNMLIVMGQETIVPEGNAPGSGMTIQRRYTNIWMKEGENWQLTARHANIIR